MLRSLFVPAFEHVGNISYSLYLSHFFAIAVFVRLYGSLSRHFDISPWLAGAALFAVCILVAQICYLLIERPSRAALQARLIRVRTSGLQTAV
jgi:peptidoglycan/LPS O-acetylase OafA/YrhL